MDHSTPAWPLQGLVLPEAPCSVNAYLDLPVIGRTQVTGRGQTGEEAATHFSATAQAIMQRFPRPEAPTPPTLGELLTKWLAKAAAQGDMALAARIGEGALLYLAGLVDALPLTTTDCSWLAHYAVTSPHFADVAHAVALDLEQRQHVCDCPWGGEAAPCAHVIAARLALKLTA